jgi:hypothetical protein
VIIHCLEHPGNTVENRRHEGALENVYRGPRDVPVSAMQRGFAPASRAIDFLLAIQPLKNKELIFVY